MKKTYRAMQVASAGTLELVEHELQLPEAGHVLIEVEACGICGADKNDIEKVVSAHDSPRVPGHEVVGKIIAVGDGTPPIWKLGMRVGVGRLGGHCHYCEMCAQGKFNLCQNQPIIGSSCDGGYAEMMIARSTALVSIPAELSSEEAAPILCAGIATFNALKKCGAEAGDTVVILGIGGLGHMAIQYASKMGYRTVAVGRGNDIADMAIKLGAHDYIDTNIKDYEKQLQQFGGVKAIISTVDNAEFTSTFLTGLSPDGRLVLLGLGKEPLSIKPGMLVGGQRSLFGSITGTPNENEKALKFSVLTNARPKIETLPLEKANEAYQKMKAGKAEFRMVLTMKN
ncbi:zinc-binding dehydrogenase [Methylophaga sulfidovorans]|uniref:Alcohol dehydrogenase n=1 Tax=Methylophaga sulfidovorans TaxID=45496 RepID=A0A1I3YW27_9GAMM|nr:alcohol dehydrogenase catalytic domain-containing protein [Methylophaga sulfidovorans]SFK36023.1 alcohol dehydrogenase [Methylophaga sulfidovorans]